MKKRIIKLKERNKKVTIQLNKEQQINKLINTIIKKVMVFNNLKQNENKDSINIV